VDRRQWRRNGLIVVVLAAVLAVDTVLPWFGRTTILPAGDGHLEVLNAWMTGEAVAPAGSGPAGPLRTVPWGLLMLAVAAGGVVSGLLARRRVPGRPGARTAGLACTWTAALGVVAVALAWAGAAAGVDTSVQPWPGVVVALAVLTGWLVAGGAMLRASERRDERIR
jgi:hypothetical protein